MSDYFPAAEAVLPLWRKADPDTSKAAGEAAREFLGEHERLILESLAAGPGTKDEIASRCGLSEQQVARRMAGMKRRGLVVDTGERRASASGCAERVWQVSAASR
jgi:predicted ArsR family transcriptional regulator